MDAVYYPQILHGEYREIVLTESSLKIIEMGSLNPHVITFPRELIHGAEATCATASQRGHIAIRNRNGHSFHLTCFGHAENNVARRIARILSSNALNV